MLPNDPRGSTSNHIASDVLTDLGTLHFGRKKVQPPSRDIRAFYDAARDVLQFPLLTFQEPELEAIARAFAGVVRAERYTCYACAAMPDHVHLVVRKHKHLAEKMIASFQDASREAVLDVGLRFGHRPVWGGPGWIVFLDSTSDIWRTTGYVQDNPVKARLPRQQYPFVTQYDNWPLRAPVK